MQDCCSFICCHSWTLGSSSNVASLSLFCRYYFGRCSSELAQLVPLSSSRGRSTRYSDRLDDFFLTIPRCYKNIYIDTVSFLAQLGSGILCLWNAFLWPMILCMEWIPVFFKKKNPLILEANLGKSVSYFGDQESASIYKLSSYSHAFSQSVCIIMRNGCTFEPSSNVHYVGGNISVNVVTCT